MTDYERLGEALRAAFPGEWYESDNAMGGWETTARVGNGRTFAVTVGDDIDSSALAVMTAERPGDGEPADEYPPVVFPGCRAGGPIPAPVMAAVMACVAGFLTGVRDARGPAHFGVAPPWKTNG